MTGPRIGSLCTGAGGLDEGLRRAVGGTVAWTCENDPDAAKVVARHYPDAPNHGDLTTVDWARVEPVDWITAGFPCQPASSAGRRAGMADERWLWDEVARAIQGIRPRHVLLENVPGLLTVDRGRAFERVVCSLAAMGYVGRYGVVRASDAGAPHQRARVFVVAENTDRAAGGERRVAASGQAEAGWSRADAGRRSGTPPADAEGDGRDEGRPELARLVGRPDAAECRCPHRFGLPAIACCAANAGCCCPPADADDVEQSRERLQEQWGPTPAGHRENAAADTDRAGLGGVGREQPGGRDLDRCGSQDVAWGVYEPAIRRWQHVTGRDAPRPTDTHVRRRRTNLPVGMRGSLAGYVPRLGGYPSEKLSAAFVEWLMGLPAGWVTATPGLSRNAQLRILGNGVVPAQCALAVRALLDLDREAVAS